MVRITGQAVIFNRSCTHRSNESKSCFEFSRDNWCLCRVLCDQSQANWLFQCIWSTRCKCMYLQMYALQFFKKKSTFWNVGLTYFMTIWSQIKSLVNYSSPFLFFVKASIRIFWFGCQLFFMPNHRINAILGLFDSNFPCKYSKHRNRWGQKHTSTRNPTISCVLLNRIAGNSSLYFPLFYEVKHRITELATSWFQLIIPDLFLVHCMMMLIRIRALEPVDNYLMKVKVVLNFCHSSVSLYF